MHVCLDRLTTTWHSGTMASFSRVPVCVVWKQEFRGGLQCAAHRTSKVARRCRWRLCPLSTQALLIITIMNVNNDSYADNTHFYNIIHWRSFSELTWASCLFPTNAVACSVSVSSTYSEAYSLSFFAQKNSRGKMYNPRFNTQMLGM